MKKRWNLIKAREDMGLTALQVRLILNKSSGQMSHIERAKGNTSVEFAKKLENFFSLPSDFLLQIIDQPEIAMRNKYEIRGDVTAIFINSPKHGSMETIIDTADLEKVKQVKGTYCAMKCGESMYVAIKDRDTKKIRMLHRVVTPNCEGRYVDHINHDTLDNRSSCNLRVVNHSQNGQNRRGAASTSKSGIRNVCCRKDSKIWIVGLQMNKKTISGGTYKDLDQAELAAIELRKIHFPYSTL